MTHYSTCPSMTH